MAEAAAPALAASGRPSLLKRASLFGKSQRLQTAEAQYLMSYFIVILIVAIDFMGLTIQNPLLPYYVKDFSDAKDLGLGAATSILMFSYASSQLIATPLFGFGSDRFGRRPMLLLSVAGSCLGFFAQGFAESLVQLCIMRFITGLFGGSRPVAVAYIGDTVPPEQQPKYVSGLALGVSMSMFLGPVLGGSLGLVSLSLPCFFQSGASAVVFLLAFRYVREPAKVSYTKAAAGSKGASTTPAHKPYKRWLAANAIVGGMMMYAAAAWQTILPIYGSEKLKLDQNKIGLLFGASGLMIAVAQFTVFVPLSQRISLKAIGCIGIPIVGLLAAVPLVDKTWFVIVVCFTQGFGMALVMPNISMTVNLLSPPQKRGAMVSLTITLQAFMRMIAPLISGPLYDEKFHLPFIVVLVALSIAWMLEALLITQVPLLKKRSPVQDKKQDDEKQGQDEESERQEILQNLYKVHDDITNNLNTWRERKAGMLSGKSRDEVGVPETAIPEVTKENVQELGVWLAGLLAEHNYPRWPEHLDVIKCLCKNAFPKIRATDNFMKRMDAIEHILMSHLMLEQQWEHFVLQRSAIDQIVAPDFDWAAVCELESRSRTNSEADTAQIPTGTSSSQESPRDIWPLEEVEV